MVIGMARSLSYRTGKGWRMRKEVLRQLGVAPVLTLPNDKDKRTPWSN